MFPDSDKSIITINIWSKENKSKEYLKENFYKKIHTILNEKSEILFHYTTISNNNIYSYLELKNIKDREKSAQMIVSDLIKDYKIFETKELDILIKAEKEWPSTSKNIGIQFIAETPEDFDKLKIVSNDFQSFFEKDNKLKNISLSSKWNSWTFIYKFNKEKLDIIWLTQDDITREVYFYINWLSAWTIKSNLENNRIVIYLEWFNKNLTPDKVENLIIPTKKWSIRVWDFMTYSLNNWVSSITRTNWKISVSINADLKDISNLKQAQENLYSFSNKYNFPEWVSIKRWWESEDNKELIEYSIKSLFLAIFMIFIVLVYQFKSYSQSILILYSILITILWVNIWLFLSWNPYSMPFIIWFISLAWIVVNDAIILVDILNKKLSSFDITNDRDYLNKIIEASNTRLQPIIVTTLTTVLWISPLFWQWTFWETFTYTVVFWLTLGSFMTLIIIPIIYKLFYKKRFQKIKN
jgi:multidrug efflux pump subunit AcrB